MISQEALERLAERLVNRIEELNVFMIRKLGEQILTIGELTPTQLREVFQSVKYGNNLNSIINEISRITNLNIKDIYEMFEEVAKKNQNFAKQFYEYRNIEFIPYEDNIKLQQITRAIAENTINNYINLSNTTGYFFLTSRSGAYTSINNIYQQLTDEAILSISMGRETYQQTMSRMMKALTDKGIRTIDYVSGRSRRLDSAVRMNIMEGVRTLNNTLQEQFGQEFGADGVEIVHHKNPAPDHSQNSEEGWHDVDGEQFSINGTKIVNGKTYEDFNYINDSLNRPVSTLNCYHFKIPIILGVSEPLHSKEQLRADKKANTEGFDFEGKKYTNYEGTQLQRQLETKIRQYKDRQIGAVSINDYEEVYKCQKRITQLTQKYKELSDISGLPTKIDRLKVYGYQKLKNSAK